MMNTHVLTAFALIVALLAILPAVEAGETRVYLNDTSTYDLRTIITTTLFFSQNLTLEQRINSTFTLRAGEDFIAEYLPSDGSNQYLLRFRRNYNGAFTSFIEQPTCTNPTAYSTICSNNCGDITDSGTNVTYRVEFRSATQDAQLYLNGAGPVTLSICTNVTSTGSVKFTTEGSGATSRVAENFITANNLPPTFLGNLSNLTWNEDTPIGFNISGNYSDANNDSMRYTHNLTSNFTVLVNNITGIINITPSPNYFGTQFVQFFAFDGDNSTGSNIINLTVLNVNDFPNISTVILSSDDSNNQSNGTLLANWSYSDIEGDLQQGNETLWYRNGTENASLRNLTRLLTNYTAKNENWTFSVRAFDGMNFSAFLNSTPLLIRNTPPIHATPIITSSDQHNRKNTTLSCLNQSTSDNDTDSISNFIAWYANSQKITTAINSTQLQPGNYSKGDNITCEIAPFDGEVNGTRKNATTFTISNAIPLLNSSIADKLWEQDSSTTFNISAHFLDIDSDNLSFNFTPVNSITISIVNTTGTATLSSAPGFSGSGTVTFFALDGQNITSSNNVTLTITALPTQSSPSSSSGGGGGGGGSGNVCRLEWQCDDWDDCKEGEQKRMCRLIDFPLFRSVKGCPQNTVPQQERICAVKEEEKETCNDGIRNQDEKKIDCGGMCRPCAAPENILEPAEEQNDESNKITGAVVGGGSRLPWIVVGIMAALVLGIFIYAKFLRPKK